MGFSLETKAKLSLVPPIATLLEAKVLEYGATKHGGEYNWRKVRISYLAYLDKMLRHTMEVCQRNDSDPETTLHHLAHVRADAGILLDALQAGQVIDDRPK